MNRLRSNEVVKITRFNETKMEHKKVPLPEMPSDIEKLAAERRQLVFWLLKEAYRSHALIVNRLLVLFIAECILLTGLALIPAILLSGSGFSSLPSSSLFVMGEILAVFLLVIPLILTMYGIAFISTTTPTINISGEKISRKQVLDQAQANLARLRQVESQAGVVFRGAVIFLFLALLTYLLVVFILLL